VSDGQNKASKIHAQSLSIKNGTPEELQDHARELEEKATRLLRDAVRLRTAAQEVKA